MKNVVKVNRSLILALVLVVVLSMVLCVGCNEDDKGDTAPCTEHNFVRVESELNRAPSYDKEGRELRACSICGVTASFVVPKLEKVSFLEDPAYLPILDSYTVSYGESLGEIATKYFTAGWSFVLDKETKVGDASTIGYDYKVSYTPSSEMYGGVERTIKLVVNKAVLQESDVHLSVEIIIPTTINSIEEIPITLLGSQEIAGTVRWVENQEILRNQVAEYEYIFTPEDTDNYEIYLGKVMLKA